MDEKENEGVETPTNSNEDADLENDTADESNDEQDDSDDVESLKAELEREREARRQLTARAKKSEEELKKVKTTSSSEDKKTAPQSKLEVQREILRDKGYSDELLGKLEKIAQFNGTDLITAQKDELFIAFQAKEEQRLKEEKASLGASKGSGVAKPKKSFTTPGLSEDEHKELFNKALGR